MTSTSTSTDGQGRSPGAATRGTWVRLVVLVTLVLLSLLGSVVGRTGALLTDTTQVELVVSTLPDDVRPTAG